MTTDSKAAAQPQKTYNVSGEIARLSTGVAKNGKPYANFRLLRLGKDALKVNAFGKAAQSLVDGTFAEGATVRVFGTYGTASFAGADGKQVTYDCFSARHVGHVFLARSISRGEAETLLDLVVRMANKQEIADYAKRKLGLDLKARMKRGEMLDAIAADLTQRVANGLSQARAA